MASAGGDETSLEFTPTWVVALVCFSIVFISVAVDEFFQCAGQCLKKHKMWPLIGASRKIKDELMLLGFISLLLAVFQTRIGKICISEQLANAWLPCKKPDSSSTVGSFTTGAFASSGTRGRRLLAMPSDTTDYCSKKGKVPLLSVEAIHQLDIFIFVLATFHVVLCVHQVLSMRLQWSFLEIYDGRREGNVEQKKVLKKILEDYENPLNLFGSLLMSSLQKAYASLTEFEYIPLRLNFIAARDPKDPGRDFRKYIMRTLQKEFEEMIGISWYKWLVALMFLLVNVAGWHAYFWISFIPFTILFIIAIKLEFMMMHLVKEVCKIKLEKVDGKKQTQIEQKSSESSAKDLVFEFSDDDFWLHRPDLLGNLIHIVLFVNSLELAFFFFILFQYGFHSCIMGKVGFVVSRIVMGMLVQVLCMSRTLPLYAIIKSQMHLKEKQLDKQNIEKIKMLLEESQLDELIEECLDHLDEIKIRLKENEMDEEEEMCIMISKGIDKGKKPISIEKAPNIELTRTGSREGSVVGEITECSHMNSTGDIEAPKEPRRPPSRKK